MMALDADDVHRKLNGLRGSKHGARVFGAESHEFRLHPALSETDVQTFEAQHGVRLPSDYRAFLLEIGNGGAGPYHGVFKLGEMDSGHGHKRWRAGGDFVGKLALPFPYSQAWNDLTGEPDEEAGDLDEDELEARWEEFEARYWQPLDGAVPICHIGCAGRIWLVVTGAETGHVWADDRADHRGLSPIGDPARTTFTDWYTRWLENAVAGRRTT